MDNLSLRFQELDKVAIDICPGSSGSHVRKIPRVHMQTMWQEDAIMKTWLEAASLRELPQVLKGSTSLLAEGESVNQA